MLTLVTLAAGCGGPASLPPPPPASTPPAPSPTTAFVLTEAGGEQAYGMLSAVSLRDGRMLWSASMPGQAAGLVVAPRLGRAYVLAGPPPFTLTPVSLSAGTVGRPIPVGSVAWSVALAPDGTTAYVANTGDGIADLPGPIGSTITPVNLRTGQAGPAINVGDGPCGMAFTGGGTAYVSLPLAHRVTEVGLTAGRARSGVVVPSAGAGLGDAPCAMAVSADAGLLAVGNLVQDLVTPAPVVNVLDLTSHRWRRPITLPGTGNFVRELGFSPDARHVYVSAETRSGLSAALYIASVTTGQVIQARVTGLIVAFAQPYDDGTLWVATGTASGQTALLPVNAVTGLPGRAVAYVPGQPVGIGL